MKGSQTIPFGIFHLRSKYLVLGLVVVLLLGSGSISATIEAPQDPNSVINESSMSVDAVGGVQMFALRANNPTTKTNAITYVYKLNQNDTVIVELQGILHHPEYGQRTVRLQVTDPHGDPLYDITRKLDPGQSTSYRLEISATDPVGRYRIHVSIVEQPNEDCCISFDYTVEKISPEGVIAATGTSNNFNFDPGRDFIPVRNSGTDITLSFHGDLNTQYRVVHEPWGDNNVVNSLSIQSPDGNSIDFDWFRDLNGQVMYTFTTDTRGIYHLKFDVNNNDNVNGRIIGFQLIRTDSSTGISSDRWQPQLLMLGSVEDGVNTTLDLDGDGLTNMEEFDLSSNPSKSDTDADGYSDGAEYYLSSDLTDTEVIPFALQAEMVDDAGDLIHTYTISPRFDYRAGVEGIGLHIQDPNSQYDVISIYDLLENWKAGNSFEVTATLFTDVQTDLSTLKEPRLRFFVDVTEDLQLWFGRSYNIDYEQDSKINTDPQIDIDIYDMDFPWLGITVLVLPVIFRRYHFFRRR